MELSNDQGLNLEVKMITVRDLLRSKGTDIWSVLPDDPVLKALNLMSEKDIGALLVMESEKLHGIVSERDFVRSIAESERCLIEAPVSKYMTRVVITVDQEHTIEDCMKLMTDHHIRHLPVVENEKVIGVISIGDVVKADIQEKEAKINTLENYIEGRGFGQ
jgi:CBS domain-containing protein